MTATIAKNETQNTYRSLHKPPFHPPAWLFGPAWTTLYALMGYTAHRFYTTGISSLNPSTVALAKYGASLYTLQLGLNLVWTPLFFGLNKPILATFDILALGGTVAYMAYTYGQVDKACWWLSVPYLGWLTFATYLCIGVGHLNGWDLTRAQGGKRD